MDFYCNCIMLIPHGNEINKNDDDDDASAAEEEEVATEWYC